MNVLTDHYPTTFADHADRLPGRDLAWLKEVRRDALDRFAELGFPETTDEDWRNTRVTSLTETPFVPAAESCLGMVPEDLESLPFVATAHHLLVFVNGRFAPQLSRPGRFPRGVTLASLARVLETTPEPLEPFLGRVVDPGASGFAALNTAFLADGAYLQLDPGVAVEEPIQWLFLSTSQGEPVLHQPHNLMVVGAGASVTVVESHASIGDDGHLTNAITEVVAGAAANVSHFKVQQESLQASHVATLKVHQEQDSRFTSHAFSVGARLARHDIDSVLDGEGARCALNGLYVAGGRQHVDFHTRIEHARPGCTSRELYKGILDGGARGVFTGKVHVHRDAQHTDARQANANLLLSPRARVNTKPQLEIYADDVKCSHGATVGELDEASLFYLRCRGIDAATARGLLTYAFANEVLERIDQAVLRDCLRQELATRLGAVKAIDKDIDLHEVLDR